MVFCFSYTFNHVQEKSRGVWRFYRYRLIEEYVDKPVLPPPFSVFETVKSIVLYIHWSLQDKNKKKRDFASLKRYEGNLLCKFL